MCFCKTWNYCQRKMFIISTNVGIIATTKIIISANLVFSVQTGYDFCLPLQIVYNSANLCKMLIISAKRGIIATVKCY